MLLYFRRNKVLQCVIPNQGYLEEQILSLGGAIILLFVSLVGDHADVLCRFFESCISCTY